MTDWAIPQQAKLKYTQLFNLHDRTRSGFLSGLQCRDILLQSGLPRNILAEIWNLSDIDGDGQLTREEFILALYLTNNVRSGQSLPSELPADLVPPSYRRVRSISTTSVNSAASVGSSSSGTREDSALQKSADNVASSILSGCILNSNSFEDKRRENFEKGRAELERRRMKIIDEQLELLGDRVNGFKSQIGEAKAKIDSMRPERDSKMGLITSLEAQLKTIQDRKAYLHQEEISLIAIAQDLNLVNPAQAELNQIAVDAKLQDIERIKHELEEIESDKDKKSKELAESSRRLEESRSELKSLSKSVGEAYKAYKDVVEKGKAIREQLIEENKSKTIDLDSAWGPDPVFAPSLSKDLGEATINSSANDDPWASKAPFDDELSVFKDLSINNNTKNLIGETQSSPKTTELSAFDALESIKPEYSNFHKKYRALYTFEERNLDELTINPGDIITGSDQVCEPGWLSGELNGRVGLFPEAYVELIDDTEAEGVKSGNPIGLENSLAMNYAGPKESVTASQVPAPTNSVNRYRTLFSFEARSTDELTINPGDIVVGLGGDPEPGWLLVELNGQKGLIPETYVERISEVVQDQDHSGSSKSRQKRAEVATVIANYRALGQEQLNLEKGQLVLIRRKMDSGWWEGEVQVKGNESTYLGGFSELDHLMKELIESEMDYTNDLRLFFSAYSLPLSASSSDVKSIFNGLDDLIFAHDNLLEKLSGIIRPNFDYRRVLEEFFILLNQVVPLYIEFCSHQRESTRSFETKLASDIRFRQLVNECQRNLTRLIEQQQQSSEPSSDSDRIRTSCAIKRAIRNQNLPVASYIIKPMQRITKYSLLFERISTVAPMSVFGGLKELAGELRVLAQSLCEQVNDACRLKEDFEDNRRKLRWAQNHIKQTSSLESQTDSRSSFSMELQQPIEIIFFESKTNCLGDRKLIKSGSMLKWRSGRELALFLFNDLLLMTVCKTGSIAQTDDIFTSERAQQYYYKLYRAPILLENITVLHDNFGELSLDSQSSRSSWTEKQLLSVSFSDRSTNDVYVLMANNIQERASWLAELNRYTDLAQKARRDQQYTSENKLIMKPTAENCFARLLVTIIGVECINRDARNRRSLMEVNEYTLKQSANLSFHNRISVELEMKRIKILGMFDSDNETRTLINTSGTYKTQAIPLSHNRGSNGELKDEYVAKFNDESTQFLLGKKGIEDGTDYLDIRLINESKFRESYLIGRKRIDIDHLLGIRQSNGTNEAINTTSRLSPGRPTELKFYIRSAPLRCGDSPRSSFRRSMLGDEQLEKRFQMREETSERDLTVRLKFHFHMFQ